MPMQHMHLCHILVAHPQLRAQQGSSTANLSTMSLPQLRNLPTQLLQFVIKSEKNLPAAGTPECKSIRLLGQAYYYFV